MPKGEIPVLALDGPSGTGKGTIGKLLAKRLGWHYLDSGAVYRVLALMAHNNEILPEDVDKLAEFSRNFDLKFSPDPTCAQVICNGEDITDAIRTEHCGELASKYAAVSEVRTLLLDLQRAQRKPPGLVADGRDMGTTVFPDATVKFYLDATAKERANRRYKQLKEKGFDVNLARLRKDMAERDARDANRSVSPMKIAEDARRIDTSQMTIEEVVEAVHTVTLSRLPNKC